MSFASLSNLGPRFLSLPKCLLVKGCVAVVALFFVVASVSCGGAAGNSSRMTYAPQAVTITSQPANQSVPVGQTGTFTVAAAGTPPFSYQWSKNGTPVKGATSSTYTTPTITPGDNGAMFTVTVANSVSSATSHAASLSVGPRTPKTGDLRFQQVDAPSTESGLVAGGIASDVSAGIWQGFGSSIGTPLTMGDQCLPNGMPVSCGWGFETFPLPRGVSGLSINYQSANDFANLNSDLAALGIPNTVITSLDLEPANNTYGISSIQSSQPGAFDLGYQTVPPNAFQALASSLGEQSRVITGVSFDSLGRVFVVSYGWQSDTTTVYDAKVAPSTLDTVGADASNLAAEGYIITALGGNPSDGLLLVGTRVQGDTLPRSALVTEQGGSDLIQFFASGHAVVGYIFNANSGTWTWIGER